jgi:hypothetical protein
MSTTTTPTLSMYHAVREAIDSFQFHAEELAVLLRYQQLANNVLHPDDCCGWETEGCDTAMGALRDELERQGLQQRVDFEARQLFAQVRLARTLIDTIENADGRLGEDIATAQSWTDAAKTEAGE